MTLVNSKLMQIVILEDDKDLRTHLAQVLKSQTWQPIELQTTEELETLLKTAGEYRLFILDRMVGRNDAAHYIPKIKSVAPHAKILILSSISTPDEKAKWLMAGADEYMGKPVFSDELIARIHLLLKRSHTEPTSHFQIGDLVIDRNRHIVSREGRKLDLTAKEYGVLYLLGENPGRVFNKTQILESLWDMSSLAETNVVESTINHLRRKLETHTSKVEIKSKRNVGYWLEAQA